VTTVHQPQDQPDRARSLEQYRRAVRGYDEHMRFGRRLRRKLIDRLALRPGQTVLDVGCGTGLSFPLIQQLIGPEGRLIGVELSPDMLACARDRVADHGWENVTLIEAPAEEAVIPEDFDAVLFFFTHDVIRSREALDNVFSRARPGARVGSAGGKWAPRWALPVNAVVRWQARDYVTTFEGFEHPWSRLALFAPDLEVRPAMLGGAYTAHGAIAGPGTG
jgi:SAM-dependent methyltransferase